MPPTPTVRRILLVLSLALGLGFAWVVGRPRPSTPPPTGSAVPVGRRIDQLEADEGQHEGAPTAATAPVPSTPAPLELPCEVPPVDGVPEVLVEHEPELAGDASGGAIPTGKYRLVRALSDKQKKLGGRWTMLFDFASGGQGAFYRHIGLRRLSSRIEYSSAGAKLHIQSLCPDPDWPAKTFFYSVLPDGLQLMTEDGVVIVMERFADSEVEGLAPPAKLPPGKHVLPPRSSNPASE